MSSKETPTASADEQPKRSIAKRVIAMKHRYFVPKHGRSIKASGPEEAVKRLDNLAKAKKTSNE